MGTYISIPYVTRRSVSVEPSKPDTVHTTKVDSISEEDPKVEPVKEDVNDDVKEELKEEVKEESKIVEEPKEEPKNNIIEAEVVIPELLPKQLSVTIPLESEVASGLPEQAPRIPEFRGNMNSESHAVKKFNRRHRKHQN